MRHNNLDTNLNKLSTVFIAKFIRFFSLIPKKIVYCSLESLNFHISIGYSSKNSILIENGFDPDEFISKYSLSDYIAGTPSRHQSSAKPQSLFVSKEFVKKIYPPLIKHRQKKKKKKYIRNIHSAKFE